MATQGTKIAGLPFVPRKYSIVERAGKAYVTTKGRRQYKAPAKVRRRIAAGLRRFKVPILTTFAVGVPLATAASWSGGFTKVFTTEGFKNFGGHLLGFYTGYNPNLANFKFERMTRGLFPLAALMIVKRFGIFNGINRQLGRLRIPLRLS